MRSYELTFILEPDLKAEATKVLLAGIAKAVTDAKGEVVSQDEWGEKELSYPLNKKSSGVYFFWQLNLPEGAVTNVDEKIRRADAVMRYLIIKKEGPAAAKTVADKKVKKNGTKVAK